MLDNTRKKAIPSHRNTSAKARTWGVTRGFTPGTFTQRELLQVTQQKRDPLQLADERQFVDLLEIVVLGMRLGKSLDYDISQLKEIIPRLHKNRISTLFHRATRALQEDQDPPDQRDPCRLIFTFIGFADTNILLDRGNYTIADRHILVVQDNHTATTLLINLAGDVLVQLQLGVQLQLDGVRDGGLQPHEYQKKANVASGASVTYGHEGVVATIYFTDRVYTQVPDERMLAQRIMIDNAIKKKPVPFVYT
jgi:hypothetical protein